MSQLSFEIVTPSGLVFQEDVYQVLLPTPEGQIGVRLHHMPLVTLLKPGVISIARQAAESAEQWEHVATAGGFVAVQGNRVRVLADVAERADDVDEFKAKEALAQARELVQTKQTQLSLADAIGLLELNLARLKVAELHRSSPRLRPASRKQKDEYGTAK